MKHEGVVKSAQFSPDGQHVVTASEDNTAQLWNATTGQAVGVFMKHGGAVTCAQFSSDGRQVLTGSLDRTARLWDAATGKPLGEPMTHESERHSWGFFRCSLVRMASRCLPARWISRRGCGMWQQANQ